VTTVTTTLPPPVLDRPALPPRRGPVFVGFLVLFRVVATLHAALALVQPVSIGQYLDGRYGLLRLHQISGGVLVLSAMVLGVVAVGYVLTGGRWAAAACPLLFLAEGIQSGLGYNRELGVHVPLGVAIVAVALAVAVLSWTRAAGRPRPRRSARSRPAGEPA
jgi:hypothetical protein